MGFVQPLLEEDKDQEPLQAYEFEDEQNSIAKLLHLVSNENVEIEYELL